MDKVWRGWDGGNRSKDVELGMRVSSGNIVDLWLDSAGERRFRRQRQRRRSGDGEVELERGL